MEATGSCYHMLCEGGGRREEREKRREGKRREERVDGGRMGRKRGKKGRWRRSNNDSMIKHR